MNSDVSQRKFEFYNTRIVRRDYQFNNRNNNFGRHNVWHKTSRGHEYREVPKPKKQWFQKRGMPHARSPAAVSSFATVSQYRPMGPKPQSPAAVSSFATVGQCRPFTPRLPLNLTITIPNFSGVRSSNVFRFHNSSAKSVQFTPAPTGTIPQSTSCFTENRGIGDNALKSNETGINEDVEYLYTVQTKGGELIEVVDISEDTDVSNCSNETIICDSHLSSNVSNCSNESRICDSHLSSNESESGNDRMILKIPDKETIPSSLIQGNVSESGNDRMILKIPDKETIPSSAIQGNVSESGNDRMILKIPEKETIPSSTKKGAVRGVGKKRKKSTDDLHCDICASEFEFVRSRGEEIFKSRCGHMFCQLCLKGLYPYRCPECDISLHKLLKVYF